MKKIYPAIVLTVVFILANLTLPAQAPDIEIGDGTEDQGLPIKPFISYSYSQTIFLQEELNIEDQRIHRIAFYYQGGRKVEDMVRVYMAHTDQETLTGFITEGLTLVYEGPYPVMNQEGWAEIGLTFPFEYNNEDNLLIAMTEDSPGFRLNSYFYSTAVEDSKSVLATKDISPAFDPFNPPSNYQMLNYRPNVRLWFEEIPDGPAMSIQPSQLYFLYIRENEEKSLNVNVRNTGTEDLVISGLDSEGLPFISNYSGTIAPGQSQLVDIRFLPQQVGAFNGFVTLQSNTSVDPVYIYVEAFAVNEMAIIETFQETTFPPEQWSVDPNSWTRRGFGGFMGGGNATLGATSTFGYLVTPKLNIQQGDELIFYSSEFQDGELIVSHSTDQETWTVIDTLSLTRSFKRYIIDLNDYQGAGYIGFSGTPVIYLDYIIAPPIQLETPPNPSTNPLPYDGLTNGFITQVLEWNPSALAQGYKVYLGTDDPPTNLVNGQDVGTNRFFKTPVLDYDTEYFWQIVPYNEHGDAEDSPVWSFQTIAYEPVAEFPFEEGFENDNGAVPPAGWINQDGFWLTTTNANSGEFAARAPFNHPVDAILITPPLQLPDLDDMEMTFYWKNGNVFNKDIGEKIIGHDTLYVELTADHGQSWQVKGIFSAPAIMQEYMPASVDLSAFVGEEIYIRFRHSTNANPNFARAVGIDDILVQGAATEPLIWLSNDNWDAGSIANNTWKTSPEFRIRNLGADILTVSQAYFSDDWFTTTLVAEDISLAFGEEYVFTFAFEPFEVGDFMRTFTIESNGGDAEIDLLGVSEYVPPFTFEGFEDSLVPPHGWMAHDMNGDQLTWMRAWNHAIPAHTGTFSAVSFSFDPYVGNLNPDNWLVTSKISVGENQEFSFFVAAGDPVYHADFYSVYVSTTTNRLDQFEEVLWEETLQPKDTAWSERVFDMTQFAGQDIYIAFRHHNTPVAQYIVRLDDIEIRDKVIETVEAPYAIPPSGMVEMGTEVQLLTDTEDALIYYTLNGDEPDTESTLYEEPIVVNQDLTIRAVAWKDDIYSDVSVFEYTIDETWVNDITIKGFEIYPNPVTEILNVRKSNDKPAIVSVFSTQGKLVSSFRMVNQELQIDVRKFEPGIYILKIDDGENAGYNKLIIQ